MHIETLMIEVTRRCNMNCKHCLRGCAENINMGYKTIDNIFKDIDSIFSLQFTGGEPLLALHQLRYIIRKVIDNNIQIGSCWFKTNGTIYNENICKYFNELYQVVEDPYCTCIDFSLDQYHDKKKQKTLVQWEELSYQYEFIKIRENLKDKFKNIRSLIRTGKAKRLPKNYTAYRKATFNKGWIKYDVEKDNYIDALDNYMVYVSANGNVISDCDLSFSDVDKYNFGNVNTKPLIDIINENTFDDVERVEL